MQRLEWHSHTKSVSGALYKAILFHSQSVGKEMANSAVFNFRQNTGSDWISLTEVGKEFQARDTAAGNAQSPMVTRHVGGTSVDVEANQRRQRPCTSAVDWSVLARYGGAVPRRQRCVRTHKRNCILSGTFNQCSSRRSGAMCSDLLAENTSRAAAFNTDCRRCNDSRHFTHEVVKCQPQFMESPSAKDQHPNHWAMPPTHVIGHFKDDCYKLHSPTSVKALKDKNGMLRYKWSVSWKLAG